LAGETLNPSGSQPFGDEPSSPETAVGQITFDGLGPYDLPNATHADAQKDGDGFMLSFRMWKSETEWTLVRIHVGNDEIDKLVRQIGDERVRSDGSTII
jgi:hypothetical protein